MHSNLLNKYTPRNTNLVMFIVDFLIKDIAYFETDYYTRVHLLTFTLSTVYYDAMIKLFLKCPV